MMNVFLMRRNTMFVIAILMCFSVIPATAQTITSNSTGTQGGYWYTFWTDGGGSVSMTLGSGGQFSVNWSNCGNFVCGKGWQTGSESRTITWSANAGGAQYVGLYGWLQNPLVEYYIPRSGGTNRGTYQADGRTYTLYTNTRVNMPSIEGTKTFEQYFCSGGGGGSVNFGQHCDGWRSLGMGVGSQNYQVVAIEGWGGSSGSASATVGSGPTTTTTTTSVGTPGPTTPPGNGDGLLGEYYSDMNFDTLVMTRVDPTIDFDWGTGSPDSSLSNDSFSIRWSGEIEPAYSENYTFYDYSDDGCRVIINNQTVIEEWSEEEPIEYTGTINLTAGQRYPIVVEYYENGGEAVAQLSWSSNSQSKQIIQQDRLYAASEGNLGDVNEDGEINILDALLIAQYYVNLDPSGFNVNNADTNCDGEINIVDALLVAQYYVDLVDSFC